MRVYKEKSEEKPEVYLRITESKTNDGEIYLVAVDESGKTLFYIMRFLVGGTFRRSCGIDPDCNFQLDNEGRIKEVD